MGPLLSRKSQILAFEAIIAVGIFMLAVMLLSTSVFSKVDERTNKIEMDQIYRSVLYATDTLLKTPGHPENWNSTNYVQLGLEKEEMLVSQGKLEEMLLLPESEIASNLGLSGYNIFINITSLFNYTAFVSYEKGTPALNPYILVPMQRVFLLENSTSRIPCKFRIEVWR